MGSVTNSVEGGRGILCLRVGDDLRRKCPANEVPSAARLADLRGRGAELVLPEQLIGEQAASALDAWADSTANTLAAFRPRVPLTNAGVEKLQQNIQGRMPE